MFKTNEENMEQNHEWRYIFGICENKHSSKNKIVYKLNDHYEFSPRRLKILSLLKESLLSDIDKPEFKKWEIDDDKYSPELAFNYYEYHCDIMDIVRRKIYNSIDYMRYDSSKKLSTSKLKSFARRWDNNMKNKYRIHF